MQKDAHVTQLPFPHNRLQDPEVARFWQIQLRVVFFVKEKELQARRFLRRLISPCILRRQQGKREAGLGWGGFEQLFRG